MKLLSGKECILLGAIASSAMVLAYYAVDIANLIAKQSPNKVYVSQDTAYRVNFLNTLINAYEMPSPIVDKQIILAMIKRNCELTQEPNAIPEKVHILLFKHGLVCQDKVTPIEVAP